MKILPRIIKERTGGVRGEGKSPLFDLSQQCHAIG